MLAPQEICFQKACRIGSQCHEALHWIKFTQKQVGAWQQVRYISDLSVFPIHLHLWVRWKTCLISEEVMTATRALITVHVWRQMIFDEMGISDDTNWNVDDSWYSISEHIWWQQLKRWWKLMCDDRKYCNVICKNTCPKLGMLELLVLKHIVNALLCPWVMRDDM